MAHIVESNFRDAGVIISTLRGIESNFNPLWIRAMYIESFSTRPFADGVLEWFRGSETNRISKHVAGPCRYKHEPSATLRSSGGLIYRNRGLFRSRLWTMARPWRGDNISNVEVIDQVISQWDGRVLELLYLETLSSSILLNIRPEREISE